VSEKNIYICKKKDCEYSPTSMSSPAAAPGLRSYADAMRFAIPPTTAYGIKSQTRSRKEPHERKAAHSLTLAGRSCSLRATKGPSARMHAEAFATVAYRMSSHRIELLLSGQGETVRDRCRLSAAAASSAASSATSSLLRCARTSTGAVQPAVQCR